MPSFVIVVDMQHDFVAASGALSVPDAETIVGPMQQWLAALSPADVAGVLLTFDTHETSAYATSAEAQQFPIHCVKETPGWDSVLDVRAIAGDIPVHTLEKGVFDMWAQPGLAVRSRDGSTEDRDAFFDKLAASGITSVTVVGVAADYCVRLAVEGLVERGFAVTVPGELTRGIGRAAEAVFEDTREVEVV